MIPLNWLAAVSVGLFLAMAALLIVAVWLKSFHRLAETHRRSRVGRYEGALRMAILGADPEELTAAFASRWPGDRTVVEDVLLSAMRQVRGPVFERLQQTAYRLGIVEKNLRHLRSRRVHVRGRALNASGVLRAGQAIVEIVDILENEALNLKLVALRALAAIGDPAVLPYFLRVSDRLPRPMIVRLASLMLEFGAPGRKAAADLVSRHPDCFPPRLIPELLAQGACAE